MRISEFAANCELRIRILNYLVPSLCVQDSMLILLSFMIIESFLDAPRISISGCVCPLVRWSVGPSHFHKKRSSFLSSLWILFLFGGPKMQTDQPAFLYHSLHITLSSLFGCLTFVGARQYFLTFSTPFPMLHYSVTFHQERETDRQTDRHRGGWAGGQHQMARD